MKTIKIECDNCNKDLTSKGRFRLKLSSEPIPDPNNIRLAVIVHPPIAYDHYFCDKNCLREWVK